MNSKQFCKCGNDIPKVRISLGYKTCVKCSTVDSYGCIDIVYHKTGNTVQVVDKSVSAEYNKKASRAGFGVMRGMKAGSASTLPKTKISNSPVGVDPLLHQSKLIEEWGEKAMLRYDAYGLDKAIAFVEKTYAEKEIPAAVADKICKIIYNVDSLKQPATEIKRISYPVNTRTLKEEKTTDIDWIFRNWNR
jgi:hypothetical protein